MQAKENPEESAVPAAELPPLTPESVLGELMRLGFANMHDYLDLKEGKPRVDLSRLTRAQACAIAEVNITTRQERGKDAEVTQVRFKLADKRQALVELGKHLGLFKERPPELPAADESRPDLGDSNARLQLARQILFSIAEAEHLVKAQGEGRGA
ncbi:MAG: terminase small subunit [Xanthobacteraceae bacterium]|nr:terminase small subunit [Xanthobacteraceae bacterium]